MVDSDFQLPEIKYPHIRLTIVIPIFNAYDFTKECIESVLKHTDRRHQVMLIDDASTDTRISCLLDQFIEIPNITVIKNSQNQGFVKNCNFSFQASDQNTDVILLNSDTIVTSNWAEKLIVAAYSNPKVATVTPLTNDGTICAIPQWLEHNEIPEGFTIDSFAKLIELISYRTYPTLPTAVGFCMYIKRSALIKIGYFDEHHFGKGYGEENDFCCRALKAGFSNILDDATFIYHHGSKSFGQEKESLIRKNIETIDKLHPHYLPSVQEFIQTNPLKNIQDNIKTHIVLNTIRHLSPILFITHNDPFESIGGTEIHCKVLIDNVSQKRPVYCMHYNKEDKCINLSVKYSEYFFKYSFPCECNLQNIMYWDDSLYYLLSSLVSIVRPTLIHIHHLLHLPISVISSVIDTNNIPYIFSVHDYYAICPSYNLIDYTGKFCFDHKNDAYCQICINSLFEQGHLLRHYWYNLFSRLLKNATKIVFPSETALHYISNEYRDIDIASKAIVIKHGVWHFSVREKHPEIFSQNSLGLDPPAEFNIAFIGNINYPKGSYQIPEIISYFRGNRPRPVKFFLVGNTDNKLLLTLGENRIKVTGSYKVQDLPKILHQLNIHLAIFPTVWAETFCLVAEEVVSCGIPIITTPVSAVAERVRMSQAGFVCSDNSVAAIVEVINEVLSSPEKYMYAKKNAMLYQPKSIEEMCTEYIKLYEEVQKQPCSIANNNDFVLIKNSSHKGSGNELRWKLKKKYPRLWNRLALLLEKLGMKEMVRSLLRRLER
ncbi:MAG: glycosyltransferase [Pseudanabaenaceae cyanobacterium]